MPSSMQPPLNEYSILSSYLLNPSPLPQIISFSDFVKTCVPSQHRDHAHIKRLYRDLHFQREIDVEAVRENIERECRKAGVLRGRLAAKIAIENGHLSTSTSKKRKRTASATNTSSRAVAAAAADDDDDDDSIPNQINSEHLKSDNDNNDADEFNNNNNNTTTTNNEFKASETIYDADAHPAVESLPVKPDQANFVPQSLSHHTTSSLLNALQASITSVKQENSHLDEQHNTLLHEIKETIGQLSDLRYGRFSRPVSAAAATAGVDGPQQLESFEDGIISALQQLESAASKAVQRMQ